MVQNKPQFRLNRAVNEVVKEATKLANSYTAGDKDAILVSAIRLKTQVAAIISEYETNVKNSMKQ